MPPPNLSKRDEAELEKQLDSASVSLLLLLFLGRRNTSSTKKVDFDPRRGVFRIDGRTVSVTTIRVLLAQIEKIGGIRIRRHLDDYLANRITLDEWYERTASTLRVSHTLSASLALGGLDRASNEETERRIRAELAFLLAFRSDVATRKVSEGRMSARAQSYLLAVPVTYWAVDQMEKARLREVKRVRRVSGGVPLTEIELRSIYREARRYRRAAESCSGCIEYSGRWIPIDKMPPIGSLDCRSRCRCFIVYR